MPGPRGATDCASALEAVDMKVIIMEDGERARSVYVRSRRVRELRYSSQLYVLA
ncbi:hypothetical protein ABIA40_006387 [Bradyrhizobium sp. USDA 223]